MKIVVPAIPEDQISNDLRWLTEVLMSRGAETTGGVLGGEFGYGAEFENEVFEMHPFYWGDCECGFDEADWGWCASHEHEATCYQQVIRARGFLDEHGRMSYSERSDHNKSITDAVCAEMDLDPEFGSYVHCTCSYDPDYRAWREENDHDPKCGIARPNFLHKPSGSRVDWYKYIGRGMETSIEGYWREILAECAASLGHQAE